MQLKDKPICFLESSFDDWTALPDGFGDSKGSSAKYTQKTEKKWLGLAKNKGLQNYIASVDVALIDENYFKITGLIRNGLWNKDLLEKPDALTLCVYSLEQPAYDYLISTLYNMSIKN
jgi:hypothetical protein